MGFGVCMKILVIEDDTLLRDAVEMMLDSLGYEVEATNSGNDIKERAGRVDLVLTDVGGIENFDGVVDHCKEIGKPLIITSGHLEHADLPKPYSIEALQAAINKRMSKCLS